MKRKVCMYLVIFIIFQGIKLILQQDFNTYGGGRIEVKPKQQMQLTYQEMKRVAKKGEVVGIPIVKKETQITSKTQYDKVSETVQVVATTAQYKECEGFLMYSGCFFNEMAVEKKRKLIVISDELAYRLFKGYDGTGNFCKLGGEEYEVVGVYRAKGSHLRRAAWDGVERVYVPITINEENTKVDNVVFMSPNERTDISSRPITLGLDETTSRINVFTDTQKIVGNYIQVPVAMLGIYIIFCLVKMGWNQIKLLYGQLKQDTKGNYIKDVLKKDFRKILKRIGILALLVGCVVLVYKSACCKVYIPDTWIPTGNLFDVEFYRDTYETQHQLNLLRMKEDITPFYMVYRRVKSDLGVLCILQICLIGLIIKKTRRVGI